MDNAHTDTLRCELVRDCLLASPALLAPYLAHWAPSMEPRDSDNWFGLIKFVNEVRFFGYHCTQAVGSRTDSRTMPEAIQCQSAEGGGSELPGWKLSILDQQVDIALFHSGRKAGQI